MTALKDLKAQEFVFGPKMTKDWCYVDRTTNKQHTGSQSFMHVYMPSIITEKKLQFVLENVKSFTGLHIDENINRGFMVLSLQNEQARQIRQYIDEPIFNFIFEHRANLIRGGFRIRSPCEMRIIYHAIGDKERYISEKERYITGHTVAYDDYILIGYFDLDHFVPIQDLDGHAYDGSKIAGKNLARVVLEIEKISLDQEIFIHLSYSHITVDDKRPTTTTIRK